MNRKQRRAQAAKERQAMKGMSSEEREMAQKVNLVMALPSECMTCAAPFDKTDREMVMSWNVVVREEEERVSLYCPDCWEKAKEIVESYKTYLEEKYTSNNTED